MGLFTSKIRRRSKPLPFFSFSSGMSKQHTTGNYWACKMVAQESPDKQTLEAYATKVLEEVNASRPSPASETKEAAKPKTFQSLDASELNQQPGNYWMARSSKPLPSDETHPTMEAYAAHCLKELKTPAAESRV